MQVPYVCVCCGDVAKASSPFEIIHYLYRTNSEIMDNNLAYFDEIAAQMVQSFKELEVNEDDMDFNEDEDYVFNNLFNAKDFLQAALENYDSLELREKFKEMFPKEQIVQLARLIDILITKEGC